MPEIWYFEIYKLKSYLNTLHHILQNDKVPGYIANLTQKMRF